MIVVCPNCGAKNRVDETAAATQQPVCGRCKTRLTVPSSSHPLVVTDSSFATDVLGADVPVLLDCWAPWCGPCRMLAPTIDALAAESGGRYRVAKLNTDENQRTAAQFGISSIPTLLIFHHGQLADRLVGMQPKPVIQARLNAVASTRA